eukprot:177151_1
MPAAGFLSSLPYELSIHFLGLATSILLLIFMVKKLGCNCIKPPENSDVVYSKSLTISIYAVFILAVILYICMSLQVSSLLIFKVISPSTNEFTLCEIMFPLKWIVTAVFEICITHLFIERLRISFMNTKFALSRYTNHIFRISYIIFYIISLTWFLSVYMPYPTDINGNIVYDGNGVMCGFTMDAEIEPLVGLIQLVCLQIGNIVTLIMFIKKLSGLIREIHGNNESKSDIKKTTDLINLMKKQSTIVCVAVVSTLVAIIVSFTIIDIITLDYVFNVFVIFLSFQFNDYYYKWFKC